jgi:hypothetical protein
MIIEIILIGLFLFVIIWCSVRLAISPLIEKNPENFQSEIPLKDFFEMNIFSSHEVKTLDEKLYNQDMKKSYYEKFNSYKNIIDGLKKDGFIDEDFYKEKVQKLKEYFEIE